MRIFHHCGFIPVWAVFAFSSPIAASDLVPSRDPQLAPPTSTACDPNAQEMRAQEPLAQPREPIPNPETYDRPQGLTADQERWLEAQADLFNTECRIAALREQLEHTHRTADRLALRRQLIEQQALRSRLQREVSALERAVEQLSRPAGASD